MVKETAMDRTIDLYSLTMDKFIYLCGNARSKYGSKGVDEMLLVEYDARPLNTSSYVDSWIFAFKDQEKYVEFCLRWM